MTNKSFIIRYILLKIILGDYQIDKCIPSENKIAEKFKCTRMHVREVYLKLIEHDILYSIHGSGYYVSKNALNTIFLPFTIVKDFEIKINDKINVFYLYNNNNCEGYIKINEEITLPAKLSVTSLLASLVENCNFNLIKIKNQFLNNIVIEKEKFNLFKTTFIKDDGSEILVETYLNLNCNINIENMFKI